MAVEIDASLWLFSDLALIDGNILHCALGIRHGLSALFNKLKCDIDIPVSNDKEFVISISGRLSVYSSQYGRQDARWS